MYRETELKNCDSVKCILMLLVVLGHSMGMWMTGGWGPYEASQPSAVLHYLADWISTFHIFSFTLVSGYIFYYAKYEKGSYKDYLPFVKKKVERLIVPYLFILVVWVIPVYIYFYGFDFSTILHRFVLGESPNQLWFLLMLFWVFVLFWPISDYARKHAVGGTVIVILLMMVGMGLTFVPNVYVFRTGLQYVLFFWIGFLIRQYGSEMLMKIPSVAYIALDMVLFISYELLRQMSGLVFTLLSMGLSVIVHLVGAVMAFVLLQRFCSKVSRKCTIFPFLTKHSMAVYLVHQQIIYFAIKLSYWSPGGYSPYAQVAISFLIAMGASLLFALLMSKTKVTRFLIGSK